MLMNFYRSFYKVYTCLLPLLDWLRVCSIYTYSHLSFFRVWLKMYYGWPIASLLVLSIAISQAAGVSRKR